MGLDLLIGAVLLGATALAFRLLPLRLEERMWARALVVAALIYVGFGARGGASAGWVGTELAGVALYGALALLGGRRSPWFVAAGWLAHVAWDVGLHSGADAPFVPAWYPAACVAYDVLAAVVIALRIPAWRAARVPALGGVAPKG